MLSCLTTTQLQTPVGQEEHSLQGEVLCYYSSRRQGECLLFLQQPGQKDNTITQPSRNCYHPELSPSIKAAPPNFLLFSMYLF